MSVKNYHAFIRAARKHGGLSLPAARKVAKKVAARLDRPVKGVDVQKHPRIFRESLSAASRRKAAGLSARSKRIARSGASGSTGAVARGRGAASNRPSASMARVSRNAKSNPRGVSSSGRKSSGKTRSPGPSRLVVGKPRSGGMTDFSGPMEYISTPEYTKRGRKGGFHLQLQIHIIGPAGLTKKKLDRIAEGWLERGETSSGIEVKALGWNGKNPTQERRGMRVARTNFRHIPFTF